MTTIWKSHMDMALGTLGLLMWCAQIQTNYSKSYCNAASQTMVCHGKY